MASDNAWPEATMMSLEEGDSAARASRRASSRGLTASVAMGLSLTCLVAVAVIGMMNTPRPVEDIIVGVDSKAQAQTVDEDAIVKRAVQQAMQSAAEVARKEVQHDVKQAVQDAITEAVSANSRLSASSLVKKLATTSTIEAKRAAGEETAEYKQEMRHISGEIDSQIGSALGTAHANEHSTFKHVTSPKYVDVHVKGQGEQEEEEHEAATPAAKSPSPKVSKAVQDKFLQMASEVLNHEVQPSPKAKKIAYNQAMMDRRRHKVEMSSEIKQYHEEEAMIKGENHKLYHSGRSADPDSPIQKLGRAPNAHQREVMAMRDFKRLQKAQRARAAHAKHVQHQAVQTAVKEESEGKAYAARKAASDAKAVKMVAKDAKKAQAPKVKSLTTPLIKDSKGHVIPVTSKKNPVYVHEEARRDDEAQKDLEKLKKLKEAKKRAKEHKPSAAAAKPHTSRGKEADEYLKIMEEEKKKEAAAAPKKEHQDRTALAEHYLKQLMKTGKSAVQWVTDKMTGPASAKHKGGEKSRDEEAKKDLSLLKSGKVVVHKGDKVEKVKLSPAIVHGEDKIAEERAALRAKEAKQAGPDRNQLAQEYLKQLKAKPAVGKPFHETKIPAAMLHAHAPDMNQAAQKDLHALKAAKKTN